MNLKKAIFYGTRIYHNDRNYIAQRRIYTFTCVNCKKVTYSICTGNITCCSRRCRNIYYVGDRGGNYKGGGLSTHGYKLISSKYEHRIIMEKHIGRKLLPSELVHHINHNKLDNRIENLQIVSLVEHNRIHKHRKKYNIT